MAVIDESFDPVLRSVVLRATARELVEHAQALRASISDERDVQRGRTASVTTVRGGAEQYPIVRS